MWLELGGERVRLVEDDILHDLMLGSTNLQSGDFPTWYYNPYNYIGLTVRGTRAGLASEFAQLINQSFTAYNLFCFDAQIDRLHMIQKKDGKLTVAITDGVTRIQFADMYLLRPRLVKDSRSESQRVWSIQMALAASSGRDEYLPNQSITAREAINPSYLVDEPEPWASAVMWNNPAVIFQGSVFSLPQDELLQRMGLRLRSRLSRDGNTYTYGQPATTRLKTAIEMMRKNLNDYGTSITGGRWTTLPELNNTPMPEIFPVDVPVGSNIPLAGQTQNGPGLQQHRLKTALMTDVKIAADANLTYQRTFTLPVSSPTVGESLTLAEQFTRNYLEWYFAERRIQGTWWTSSNSNSFEGITLSGLVPWEPTGLERYIFWTMGNGRELLGQTLISPGTYYQDVSSFNRVVSSETITQPNRNTISGQLLFPVNGRPSVRAVVCKRDGVAISRITSGPHLSPQPLAGNSGFGFGSLQDGTYTVSLEGTVGNWRPSSHTVTVSGGESKTVEFTAA
jgi:hypothetical protein